MHSNIILIFNYEIIRNLRCKDSRLNRRLNKSYMTAHLVGSTISTSFKGILILKIFLTTFYQMILINKINESSDTCYRKSSSNTYD